MKQILNTYLILFSSLNVQIIYKIRTSNSIRSSEIWDKYQEWYLSQISLLPMLFPVNTILAAFTQLCISIAMTYVCNLSLCIKHASTLIGATLLT